MHSKPSRKVADCYCYLSYFRDPKRSHWSLKGLKGALQLLGSVKDLAPLDEDKQAERGGDCPWGGLRILACAPLRAATPNNRTQEQCTQCWTDPRLCAPIPPPPGSEPCQAPGGWAGQPCSCTCHFSLSNKPPAALASIGLPVAAALMSYVVPGPPSGPEGWASGLPAICLLGVGCFRKAAGRL